MGALTAAEPELPVPVVRSPFSDSAMAYALAEKAEGTRRGYRASFRDFVAWRALREGVEATLPAPAGVVASYLAALADRGLKVSTIQHRAAAISHAHALAGFASPTKDAAVVAVMSGIRREIGVAAKPKAPATAKVVAAMIRKIPDFTLAGKRDRAMLLLGFAAALRRSELVALDVDSIAPHADGAFVHLGRSKTDQEGKGADIAVPRGKLQVIEALEAWLAAAAIHDGPLFRRIGKGDRLTADRLTGHAVALIVKRWAKAAKCDPALFSGHSLRAGFVTSALEARGDLFRIMDVTRHREVKTLRDYDRRAKAFKDHAGAKFL